MGLELSPGRRHIEGGTLLRLLSPVVRSAVSMFGRGERSHRINALQLPETSSELVDRPCNPATERRERCPRESTLRNGTSRLVTRQAII